MSMRRARKKLQKKRTPPLRHAHVPKAAKTGKASRVNLRPPKRS